MNSNYFSRRQFLRSALYSSLVYAGTSAPNIFSGAVAAPSPISDRILANLNFSGGPDFRHLIVPAYDSDPSSYGNKYWKHRWRAHRLDETDQSTWQARWNNDYYPIQVGGAGWSSGLVDSGGLNSGTTFGIWKRAGWLIDMFREAKVALIFNAVGGTNRAHDLSSLMLAQGNVLASLNAQSHSGWGGRVARSAGGKSLSLSSSPGVFSFGPSGSATSYDNTIVDNVDLISIDDTREFGLYDFDISQRQYNDTSYKMARAAKSYYAGLNREATPAVYSKLLDHERKIRQFGELINSQLATIPVPYLIEALGSPANDLNGLPINPEPDSSDANFGLARRVLYRTSFAQQIRNLYDVIALNDLLDTRVASLSYGSWDSHGNQRQTPAVFTADPNNPYESQGIESGFHDIFGGQTGASPSDPSALHAGFSALWKSLEGIGGREKLLITMAGEFGRQLRDNGDAGTDHGKGNLMLVIGDAVQGGVYGEMFPVSEIDKYDNPSLSSPDIDPRTEIDQFFSKVADWVAPGSATQVFPRMSSSYAGTAPDIEVPGMFNNLLVG